MNKEEYEIIQHSNPNFHIFLVNLLYRTPHTHKDYEISLVLDGALSIITPEGSEQLSTGDIFLMNPYRSHELKADAPALILSLQLAPAFFSSYYPQIESTEFKKTILHAASAEEEETCHLISEKLISIGRTAWQNQSYAAIRCSILVSQLFLQLLETMPNHLIPEKEKQAALTRGKRMRRIMHYIDVHYTEKLLLSDIAEQEELDLYYLSHFFTECFGITFQNYLTKVRAEHARQLLLLTDYSLLDISLSCGFSDPKYFNKGFAAQYGCTPKEYRKSFQSSAISSQQSSMLTTQKFLAPEAALVILDRLTQG